MSGRDGDSRVVAGLLEDLSTVLAELPAAVREAAATVHAAKPPEAPAPLMGLMLPAPVIRVEPGAAPVVTVNVEPANVQVDVTAPTVNVAAPAVTVEALPPMAYEVEITARDKDGYIKKFVIIPVALV